MRAKKSGVSKPSVPGLDEELEIELVDVMAGKPVRFRVDDEWLSIRQPTPEEWDDAISLGTLVTKRMLAQPEVSALAEFPASEEERLMYERLIVSAEAEMKDKEEGSPEYKQLKAQIARLRLIIEDRTLADEIAGDRGNLARDRWLTIHLLCDDEGNQLFDPDSPKVAEQWARLPLKVKNAARPAIWQVMSMVQNAPFSLAALRGQKLD